MKSHGIWIWILSGNPAGVLKLVKLKLVCRATDNRKRLAFLEMNRVMKKPTFCICENKDTDQLRGYDQLRGNREADQRLCFRYIDSTIPLLSKSKISSL